MKVFAIASISSFVLTGAASGISAVIASSYRSKFENRYAVRDKLNKKIARTQNFATWYTDSNTTYKNDGEWLRANDWRGKQEHYSVNFDSSYARTSYGNDYFDVQSKLSEIINDINYDTCDEIASSAASWAQYLSYIVYGLGFASVGCSIYLVFNKNKVN